MATDKANVLAEEALTDEKDFCLQDAIKLALSTIGVPLYGLNEMKVGKLYSPTRSVDMVKNSDNSIKPTMEWNVPIHRATPTSIYQLVKAEGGKYEFLGEGNIYHLEDGVQFKETEPLFFVDPEKLEMTKDFSVFDSFAGDLVVTRIQSEFDGKEFPTVAHVKNLFVQTINSILRPLIKAKVLCSYKVFDESSNMIVLQTKATPKSPYARYELCM